MDQVLVTLSGREGSSLGNKKVLGDQQNAGAKAGRKNKWETCYFRILNAGKHL